MPKFYTFCIFLVVLTGCNDTSISPVATRPTGKFTSLNTSSIGILHGQRQGMGYEDPHRRRFNYRYITSTIINDSTAPLKLSLRFNALYKLKGQASSFRVFILPRSLTPRRMHLDSDFSPALKSYFDFGLPPTTHLDTIIQAHQEISVTVGVLSPVEVCDPGQLALLFGDWDFNFYAHDSLIWAEKAKLEPKQMSLGLDFFQFFEKTADQGFMLIPCGTCEFVDERPVSN